MTASILSIVTVAKFTVKIHDLGTHKEYTVAKFSVNKHDSSIYNVAIYP